jgi:hypothetical protein
MIAVFASNGGKNAGGFFREAFTQSGNRQGRGFRSAYNGRVQLVQNACQHWIDDVFHRLPLTVDEKLQQGRWGIHGNCNHVTILQDNGHKAQKIVENQLGFSQGRRSIVIFFDRLVN